MGKIVSFDLGGTLINSSGANYGLRKFLSDTLGISYAAMKVPYIEHFLENRISLSNFCDTIGKSTPEQINLLIKSYYAEKRDSTLFDDVLPTLIKLKAMGYQLVSISNKAYCNPSCLSNYGLASFFDAEIYSCNIGIAKPSIDIFLNVQSMFDVLSSEIVHVGDSFDTDIAGALRANWRAVYLRRSTLPIETVVSESRTYEVIDNLLQLPSLL